MKIALTKKYRTRDGREVIVHAINGPDGAFPVVASVQNTSAWMAGKWRITGTGSTEAADLIEVREPMEWEIWIHPQGGTQRYEPCCSGWEGPIRVREIID